MNKIITCICGIIFSTNLFSQFAPAVGVEGTTAIYKDSSIIKSWANGIYVERGFLKITDTTYHLDGNNKASFGYQELALGNAKEGTFDVISLGDGGKATLSFPVAISNGPGFDFVVFENAITDGFLELAFVEVSSDGIHFHRFPSISLTQTTSQVGSFSLLDPTKIHNLAGKYRNGYGVPFDLDELPDDNFLNKNYITHVRVIDVIGTIMDEFASYDSQGNKINDPFPTAFETGGFDLEAIGVIHETILKTEELSQLNYSVFPNPTKGDVNFRFTNLNEKLILTIYTMEGKILYSDTISSENSTIQLLPTIKNAVLLYELKGNKSYSNGKIIVE